jgi:hypothetical protein
VENTDIRVLKNLVVEWLFSYNVKRHKTKSPFFFHDIVRERQWQSLATGMPHAKTEPNIKEMSESRQ